MRHRVGARSRDILGELISLDDERLSVRREDGRVEVVPVAEVVAGKPVPPRPAKYSEIDALERVADTAWPATTHERLGEWFLRAADGFTNRANSALPLGDPGVALPAALAAIREWYGDRGLPPKVTVPLPLRRDVADAATAAGWVAQPRVLVQTAPLASLGTGEALLTERPSPDFLEIITARKAGLPAAADHVLTAVPQVRFAEARDGDDGSLLAITRGAVVGEWLHIAVVEVVERARRRGLARHLAGALATWAGTLGANRAVLQVEERNAAAVPLYASLGFRTHHTYITYHWPSTAA